MSAYRAKQRNQSQLLKDNLKYSKDMKNKEKNANLPFFSSRKLQRIHGYIQTPDNNANNNENNKNTKNSETINKIQTLQIENDKLQENNEKLIADNEKLLADNEKLLADNEKLLADNENFSEKVKEVNQQIIFYRKINKQIQQGQKILELKNKTLEASIQEYKKAEKKGETKPETKPETKTEKKQQQKKSSPPSPPPPPGGVSKPEIKKNESVSKEISSQINPNDAIIAHLEMLEKERLEKIHKQQEKEQQEKEDLEDRITLEINE